jgi:hypothetical protein
MMFYRSPVEMSSVVYADGMAYIYWIYFTFGFDYTRMRLLHELSVRGAGENFHFTALIKPSIVPV